MRSIDKHLLAAGLVVLVAFSAYFNGLDGDFAFDDIPLLSTDEFYADSGTSTIDCWSRCYWRKGMDIGQYRPVTLLSFLWNARLAGMSSPVFRIVNLLLHILVALLILKIAPRVGLDRGTAIFAALLFAAHPLHSEAVIPATGRAELLCAVFTLLGLLAHVKFSAFAVDESIGDARFAAMKTTARHLAAPLFFILACWSKENGVVLLPLCALYDLCFRLRLCYSSKEKRGGDDSPSISNGDSLPSAGEPSKKNSILSAVLRNYAGFALALAILAATRLAVTGTVIPKLTGRDLFVDNPVCDAAPWIRILTAFHVQGLALLKFFWPATLSHDYSFAQITPVTSFLDPLAVFATLSLLVLPPVVISLLGKKTRPTACFLWLAYMLSILPAGNFIVPAGTIFGERLTYLPSVWLCMMVTAAIMAILTRTDRRVSSKRLFLAESFMCLAILAALFRTGVRTEDWKSMRTLAVSAVGSSPMSVKTWNNLAVELAHQNKFEEAIAACDKALSIKPDFQSAKVNKIWYLLALKKYAEAKPLLKEVLENGSNDYELHNALAVILGREGKEREAANLFEKSLSINPNQKNVVETLKKIK
jgi:hypothetical protein